ncbi:hypothetical protein BHM03_00012467 [Ensete ventricosum]|uniref:Uncharacterized protein n=1 Tax=Ensete ventricosum TaxID=4639 RepID=A0A445MDI8_ENSVE|nr:hypothetical protein BHM03_00012467 [Ensete ventricosum]
MWWWGGLPLNKVHCFGFHRISAPKAIISPRTEKRPALADPCRGPHALAEGTTFRTARRGGGSRHWNPRRRPDPTWPITAPRHSPSKLSLPGGATVGTPPRPTRSGGHTGGRTGQSRRKGGGDAAGWRRSTRGSPLRSPDEFIIARVAHGAAARQKEEARERGVGMMERIKEERERRKKKKKKKDRQRARASCTRRDERFIFRFFIYPFLTFISLLLFFPRLMLQRWSSVGGGSSWDLVRQTHSLPEAGGGDDDDDERLG